jgi:signal transduction histidine kinase
MCGRQDDEDVVVWTTDHDRAQSYARSMRRRRVAATALVSRHRLDWAAALVLSIPVVVQSAVTLSASRAVCAAVVSLLATTSVAWRRRLPVFAVLMSGTATVAFTAVTRASPYFVFAIVLILVMYAVAADEFSGRAFAVTGVLVGYLVGVCCAAQALIDKLSVSAVAEIAAPVAIAPSVIGLAVARGRHLNDQLIAANARLEAEREVSIALAAMRERNRIARDLHDVVAHGVSVMVVQSGAARITLNDEPDLARESLREVAAAGRAALVDLRRVVGTAVLPEADLASTPDRVDELAGLVTGCRAGGVKVAVDRSGPEPSGPIGEVVFRVVQEALTNVLRHAPGATAAVSVHTDRREVRVSVLNSPVRAERDFAGSGRGLLGMRERVQAIGGTFNAATTLDGGFAVSAKLPLPVSRQSVISRVHTAGTQIAAPVIGGAIACGLAVDALVSSARHGPAWTNLCVVLLIASTLVWRRRSPLLFLIAINVLALPLSGGLTSINAPTLVSTVVFVAPTWTVSVWSAGRTASIGLAIEACFIVGEGWYWSYGVGSVVSNLVGMALLWTAGRVVGAQRRASEEVARLHAQLGAESHRLEQLRLDLEHDRLVGQLRSQVVDQVSGMVVAAEALARADPSSADAAGVEIQMIEHVGRQALVSLREILGLLRIDLDPSPLSTLLAAEASR